MNNKTFYNPNTLPQNIVDMIEVLSPQYIAYNKFQKDLTAATLERIVEASTKALDTYKTTKEVRRKG